MAFSRHSFLTYQFTFTLSNTRNSQRAHFLFIHFLAGQGHRASGWAQQSGHFFLSQLCPAPQRACSCISRPTCGYIPQVFSEVVPVHHTNKSPVNGLQQVICSIYIAIRNPEDKCIRKSVARFKAFLSNEWFEAHVRCLLMFEMNNDAVILCLSAIKQGAFTPTVIQANPGLIFRTVPRLENSFYTKGFTVKLDLSPCESHKTQTPRCFSEMTLRCVPVCFLEHLCESLCCLLTANSIKDPGAPSSPSSYVAPVRRCPRPLCTPPARCLCGCVRASWFPL